MKKVLSLVVLALLVTMVATPATAGYPTLHIGAVYTPTGAVSQIDCAVGDPVTHPKESWWYQQPVETALWESTDPTIELYYDRKTVSPGSSNSWTANLWANPGYTDSLITLNWFTEYSPTSLLWVIDINRPNGELYAHLNASNSLELNTIKLPTIVTNDWHQGWSVGIRATDTSSVPEPGSLVALATGFISLIGFGLRRRQ